MSRLQTISRCAADFAQIGLLILAAFGYFYTVRPVYQKDLLDEQIAKKEIKIEKLTEVLGSQKAEIADQTKTLTDLKAATAELRRQNDLERAQTKQEYDKLRVKLLQDFAALVEQSCSLGSVAAGQFGTCVTKKVLSDDALSDLSDADKARLRKISVAESAGAARQWTQAQSKLDTTNEAGRMPLVKGQNDKCALANSLKDSKDVNEKVSSQYECQKAQLDLRMFDIKFDVAKMFQADDVTRKVVTTIIDEFFAD